MIYNKKMYGIYVVLVFVSLVYIVWSNSFSSFWYDEGFSINMMKHSWIDIWHLSSLDVHPPLYYYLLKIFTSVFGVSVATCRAFSALASVLTILVAVIHIRRLWGNKTAMAFIVLFISFSDFLFMTAEVRMYSWVFLFVLLTYVYAYKSYFGIGRYSLAIFWVSSIIAGYLHYFALIAVFFMYLFYFIFILRNKGYKKLKGFLSVSILFVVAYSPWLNILLWQIGSVKEEYWIELIKFKEIVWFLFPYNVLDLTKFPLYKFIKYLLLTAQLAWIILACVQCKPDDKDRRTNAIFCFLAFLCPLVFVYLYSVIVRPVLVPRYIICLMPMFLLGIAQLFSIYDLTTKLNKIVFGCFSFAIVFGLIFNTIIIMRERYMEVRFHDKMMTFIEQDFNDSTIFLYRDSLYKPMGVNTLLYPNNRHISKKDSVSHHTQMLLVAPHEKIKEYEDLLKYPLTNVYTADHFWSDNNPMTYKKDSTELVKYFDIVRSIEIPFYYKRKFLKHHDWGHRTIYELKPKKAVMDSIQSIY